MPFGATLVVAYGGANKTLNRINQDNYGSEYYLREATIEYRLKIRHSKESPSKVTGKGFDRHNVELTVTVLATPTTPAIVRQAYSVFRNDGYDDFAEVKKTDKALSDLLSSGSVIDDLLSWLN